MSMGAFRGSGLPAPPEYKGPMADEWGRPRENEDVPTWYARELAEANSKLKGSRLEGHGRASVPAGMAFERHSWNQTLAEGRRKYEAEQAAERAAVEAERQQRLTAARQAKAEADKRKDEDALLAWHESQRQQVPGRL